ncbi:MAG: flavodoxin reductase family protein [Bacteroidetes bacterium]|nr:MAG: flavodoxin reductase family protein [Bacteroidota bacterium]
MKTDNTHAILSVRHLTATAYVLQMTRRGLGFRAGQHLLLGKSGSIHNREYSVYSGEKEDFFEVLIKEVDDGLVSKQLKKLQPGDHVQIEGPLGFFTIDKDFIENGKFLFVATGSGIAPFHSFTRSYPELNYTLLHGVRKVAEAYEKDHYPKSSHILCTSAEASGDFHGRVTDYLRSHPVSADTHCYLCGNFNMIHEAFDILEQQGVPADQVHAEVYF